MFNNKPVWYDQLPEHLKPSGNKVKRLEVIREKWQLSNDIFPSAIANSKWSCIKAQEATFESFKKQMPTATRKEICRAVIVQRLGMKIGSKGLEEAGMIPANPWDKSKEELEEIYNNLDIVMEQISDIDDVVRFILEVESGNLKIDQDDPIQQDIDNVLFDGENTSTK